MNQSLVLQKLKIIAPIIGLMVLSLAIYIVSLNQTGAARYLAGFVWIAILAAAAYRYYVSVWKTPKAV